MLFGDWKITIGSNGQWTVSTSYLMPGGYAIDASLVAVPKEGLK